MKRALSPTVVLGVGNVMMKDDGAGVWIVRSLVERYRFPPGVRLVEGGVGGIGLLPILAGAEAALIVDAVDRGDPPGTLFRIDAGELPAANGTRISAHEIGLVELLDTARFMGCCPRTRIVGIQPSDCRSAGKSLTPAVRRAVPRAREAVVAELRAMGIVSKPIHAVGRSGLKRAGKGGRTNA
jgi:hydrogenase maturation protease